MEENRKKLALADLIAKRETRASKTTRDVYVDVLEGSLTVEKIPLVQMTSLMDGLDSSSPADVLQAKIDLIYACCPILHNGELRGAYECQEPTDIVCRLLDDNMGAINELSYAILDLYGLLGDDVVEDVKNG